MNTYLFMQWMLRRHLPANDHIILPQDDMRSGISRFSSTVNAASIQKPI